MLSAKMFSIQRVRVFCCPEYELRVPYTLYASAMPFVGKVGS